uniref:Uncharacterized protein n=1 Tax=Cacopsylla melanoneura TaxID=428564 RepID=A0A8D8VTP0_9HEMI
MEPMLVRHIVDRLFLTSGQVDIILARAFQAFVRRLLVSLFCPLIVRDLIREFVLGGVLLIGRRGPFSCRCCRTFDLCTCGVSGYLETRIKHRDRDYNHRQEVHRMSPA